jgi:hypothetical protein
MSSPTGTLNAEFEICRKCGREVVASAADYAVFEQMHFVCFHFEFEHLGDPDVECLSGGCPAAGLSVPSPLVRVAGVDLVQAGNTVAPAILTLLQIGCRVEQEGDVFVAHLGSARFQAQDPVAVLGLIKLAETRHPWSASDTEVDSILEKFVL